MEVNIFLKIGLSLDHTTLTFDQWSSVINRVFSGHKYFKEILKRIHSKLEHLTKEYLDLKPFKENLTKLTMTTLVECMLEEMSRVENHHDASGKHVVELYKKNKL